MKKIRILIADDHNIVRSGLRMLFQRSPGLSVVGEARDGEEAVRMAEKCRPDVAILDISMPRLNGIQATRLIKERFPKIKVLILTIHEEEEFIYEMIRSEADGHVLKSADRKEIINAVHGVAAGGPFYSSAISTIIINKFVRRLKAENEPPPAGAQSLTKREMEILRLVAHGLSSKEIADKLYLSVSTVNTHRTNLMHKLDIHDSVGLTKYAIRSGLIEVTP